MSAFDPEKPYIDAGEAADRVEGYIDKATDDLLFRLKELQEAQSFVRDHCDDAESNLALLLSIIVTPGLTVEATREKLIAALSTIIMPYCEEKGRKDMEEDTGEA